MHLIFIENDFYIKNDDKPMFTSNNTRNLAWKKILT